MLMQRGRRGASCRVFAPGGSARNYTVILEESGIREQFFIESGQVDRFVETGNEQFVLTAIRSGVRNLDRLVTKKKSAHKH
jgi:hypothetical protein